MCTMKSLNLNKEKTKKDDKMLILTHGAFSAGP